MSVDFIPGLARILACLKQLSGLKFWDRSLLYPRLEDNDSSSKYRPIVQLRYIDLAFPLDWKRVSYIGRVVELVRVCLPVRTMFNAEAWRPQEALVLAKLPLMIR